MIPILTDIHFGCRNGNEKTFEQQMSFFESQFFPFIIENKISDVICCGDLFDDRNKIDIFILQELKTRFFPIFQNNNINFHWILGNHDIKYNNTLKWNVAHASDLSSLPNVIVYNQPTRIVLEDVKIGLVPWIVDGTLDIPDDVDVVCGHFEMKGFNVTKSIESKHGFSVSDFKKYKKVFSGHFHIASNDKNITYIGNPYQKDWGDYNLSKGFITLNNDLSYTFHENVTSPRFVQLEYTEKDKKYEIRTRGLGYNDIVTSDVKDLETVCHSNHIKFIVNGTEQKRIDKIYTTIVECMGEGLLVQMIDTTEIVQNINEEKMETEIKEDSDVIGNMILYTESVELNEALDKELLQQMFKDIYVETLVERG